MSAAVPGVLLATAVLVWGTSFWPTQVASDHSTILLLAALRIVLGGLVLLAALPLVGSRLPRGRLGASTLLTGPMMVGFFQWGITYAVHRCGPGNAAVLINTSPLFVLVFGWLSGRERPSLLGTAGLGVGFAGVVLMVSSQLGGATSSGQMLAGSAVALAAAVGWAVGTLMIKDLGARYPSFDGLGYAAAQYLVSAALVLPVALAVEGTGGTDWNSPGLWGAVIWIGPIVGIATALFMIALMRTSATRASAVVFLVPATAIVVEAVRGHAPGWPAMVGMLLAVGGVACVSLAQPRLADEGSEWSESRRKQAQRMSESALPVQAASSQVRT
jgi:drug/metabolite transporter (DMT)-like permease